MGFKKMERPKYPPRLWSLVGYPGSGKSSFAAQMNGPMVVVDADQRFTEVMEKAQGDVFQLSDNKADNVEPELITKHLLNNMPGSGVKTIIVDSLTAIITPLVVKAMLDNENGKNRNKMSAFRTKALAMRQLQDSITRWGSDVLWIYHNQDSRDGKANAVTRATISQTELARLTRSINLQLEIVQDGERRGIRVQWARRGRAGMVLWDDTGDWTGMPATIEAAVYDGLSKAEQDAIEKANPDYFPNPETAISWAMDKGAVGNIAEGQRLYTQVKEESKPKSAREMAAFWVEAVTSRLTARAAEEEAKKAKPKRARKKAESAPMPEPPPAPEPSMEDIVF